MKKQVVCKICGANITTNRLKNISRIEQYPICENCKNDIVCEECFDTENLVYVEEYDKLLCVNCIDNLRINGLIKSTANSIDFNDEVKVSDNNLYNAVVYLNKVVKEWGAFSRGHKKLVDSIYTVLDYINTKERII